jgi:hypothetical protein
LTGETEVLGENLPQCPTCCPDANPGRRVGKSATNRLSYGTAKIGVETMVKYTVFWGVTPCSPIVVHSLSKKRRVHE